MASPTELETDRPVLLPADFDQWDSADVPATLPEDFSEFDAVPQTATVEPDDKPTLDVQASEPAASEDAASACPVSEEKTEAETKQVKTARHKSESRREQARAEKNNWTKVELRRAPEPLEDKSQSIIEVSSDPEEAVEEPSKSNATPIVMGAVLLLLMIALVTWFVAFRKPAAPSTSELGPGRAENIARLQVQRSLNS